MTDELVVPQSQDELRAYVLRYFANLDELDHSWEPGDERRDRPPISELIYELVGAARDEDAWPIVLALVDAAPTRSALAFVAADTLELLIRYPTTTEPTHRRIVEAARANAKLREAFGFIYWGDGEPDWFRSEIEALGVTIN